MDGALNMVESTSGLNLLNVLAYEFTERYRRGERPSLNEYKACYPKLAEEIQALFATLVMIERQGSGDAAPVNPSANRPKSEGPIPDHLGDYRILREIGRGGMGIVYEAVQESLGRHVALKVLTHNQYVGSAQLLRFQREARAAALLHHTNIVPVFGVGEHGGVEYYAMQYIQGQSLDTVLQQVRRQRREVGRTRVIESASSILGGTDAQYFRSVARVGIQVAEALAYAHLHGVVHRDIKPGNLLLDQKGTIWVTDFGLAKEEGADELTSPGDVVGTLRYLAPERFQGKTDPRSDLYSLGLTLYEMITLKPAFPASHRVQLINAILHDEPARPRSLDPGIPRDLETIVLKAVSKNPSDRFLSALAMAAELKRYVEGRPIRLRRVSLPERIWRWSERNPAVAVLLLLATSLTAILLAGSALAAWNFHKQRDALEVEQRNTKQSLDKAVEAEQKQRAELGRSLLVQARAMRYSGQPERRFAALKTLARAAEIAHESEAPAQDLAELRDEVIAALALIGDRQVQEWPGLPAVDGSVGYCAGADRYVTVGRKGVLSVRRLSDRSVIQVMGSDRPSGRSWPVFVPGGRFFTIWSGTLRTELWDIERGAMRAEWPGDVRCAVARADGAQVAALRSDGELRIYNLPAMNVSSWFRLGTPVRGQLRYPWMSLSDDGHRLALILPDENSATVYDVASGRMILEMEPPSARVDTALALSQNGGLLAVAHDRAISVYDVADGERLSLLQGHQSEGIVVHFQPGGGLLASTGWDSTTRLWDPIRGRLLVTLDGGSGEWIGGGSSLAMFMETSLFQHEIAVKPERRTIDYRMVGDHAGAALYGPARVAYSPDGRLIAMAVRPEGVRIARVADGVGLAYLPVGNCDEVLFLPGGAILTFSQSGLCRWPVRRLPGGILRMGPAEPLAFLDQIDGFVSTGLAASASGRLVGAGSPRQPGALLLDPLEPRKRRWLIPHVGATDLAISPDGRWAASGARGESAQSKEVRVWDTATARLVKRLPVGNARVAFSPDGQWLGVGGEARYRFYRTGSWTPEAQVESGAMHALPLAFHPGSRIAAILDSKQSRVRLVEIETGAVVAALEAPDQSTTMSIVCSPAGRYLAAAQSDQRVDLWDLFAIRCRLVELDLAAGIPDIFQGETTSGEAPTVDRIEVEGADPAGLRLLAIRQILKRAWFALQRMVDPALSDAEELRLRAGRWERLGQWRLAAADYRASLALRPDSDPAAYLLARCLTLEPGRGPAVEAVRWARIAALMHTDNVRYANTLGAALYRAGRLAEADALLERCTPQDPALAGYSWLFLAMTRQRLGQTSGARTAVAEAKGWRAERLGTTSSPGVSFRTLLHEAESVLDGSRPELPANVFDR